MQTSGEKSGTKRRRKSDAEPSIWRWVGPIVLLLLIAVASAIRIGKTYAEPSFDPKSSRGLLRSDPAALYYFTERIVESGGRVPNDFRADPRLEYPEKTDIPAIETPAQEFFVAWLYLLFGKPVALHVFCVWTMSIFASLALIGVYGFAFELTRSHRWACLASAFFAVLPANYRTIGFVLIREDFAMPFFALHLWLLMRAVRVQSVASIILAAIAFVFAISTWHAMTFIAACELGILFLFFLRNGAAGIFQTRKSWIGLALIVIAGLLVPVLRSKLFLLSLPMQIAYALFAAGVMQQLKIGGRATRIGAAVVVGVATLFASVAVSKTTGRGGADFAHVYELMLAKIKFMGVKPNDPAALSPQARMMWVEPFETASLPEIIIDYTFGLILLLLSTPSVLTRIWKHRAEKPDSSELIYESIWFASVLAVMLTIAIERLAILPGLLTPVWAAMWLRRTEDKQTGWGAMIACTILQCLLFVFLLARYTVRWYQPPGLTTALRELLDQIDQKVPAGEPVAADFVTGAAILAETNHPIIQQPKYETARSRQRVIDFVTAYNAGTVQQFHDLVKSYGCHYLALDLSLLWSAERYTAGVPESQTKPSPGTAARAFMDPALADNVPGFRLIYRPPPDSPVNWYRLYEVE